MKWVTTDYKGNKKVWYSEDVIEQVKEIASYNSIDTCWTMLNTCDDCPDKKDCNDLQSPFEKLKTILNFLNEVDND